MSPTETVHLHPFHADFDTPLEAGIADAMAELAGSEFAVSLSERLWEKWLGDVERLTAGRLDSEGTSLLMSDEALEAFEEGVTAADYALQIQAACGTVQP